MRLLSLALLSAAAATFAQAQSYYTYTDTFASYNSAAWQYPQGSGLNFGGSGLNHNGSGGFLYNPSYYGSRQEIRATMTNNGIGAQLWLAMNVSGTTVTAGFVVALEQGGFGPLARIYQVTSGSWTELSSFYYTAASPLVARAILVPGGIRVVIGSYVHWVAASTFMGSPGVGFGWWSPTTTYFTQAQLAGADTTAPPNVSGLTGSGSSSEVQLQWTGVSDNAGGSGLYRYNIYRNGALLASTSSSSYTDSAVSPATTYTYLVKSEDYQANESTGTSVVVSTGSSSGASDPHAPRQTGVRPLGSYWGAAGENIDMRSGNLNFSLPLLKAQGRHGVSLGLGLSYNSQNWRKNGANTFKIGADVGYGFGWRLAAGSIFPVWNGGNFSHYIFTDATGAEYRLDVNDGNGNWWSKEGLYVAYEAGTQRVRFMDGTYWDMYCASAGTEQDAGTYYPTRVTDSNGNFLYVMYKPGIGQGAANTSARIDTITDIRNAPNPSYVFTYNTDAIPHLTGIAAQIPTGENYSFAYTASATLYSPFTPQVAHGTAQMLQTATVTGPNLVHTFEYGSNGAGEMSRVILPYQGDLRWYHDSFAYPNGQTLREVRYRYLTKQAGAATTTYTLQYDTAATNNLHAWSMIDDPNGISRKQWNFNTASPTDPYFGLVNLQQDIDRATGTAKNTTAFTWAADARGNRFITASLATIDPGTAYQKQLKSEQMLDLYGNITWSKAYDFNNLTTPKATYNYTYLTGSQYAQRFIFNRKTAGPYSGAGYDNYPGGQLTAVSGLQLHDSANYPPTMIWRGNATAANVFGGYGSSATYDVTGFTRSSTNGQTTTASTPDSKNVAPTTITPNGNSLMAMSAGFNSVYQLTSVSGPNGASTTMAYGGDARPQWTTGPHGQTTFFYYYDSLRMKQSGTGARWTKAWFDGFGRTIKEEAGTGTTTVSIVDTEYDSCGCSPLGKVKRVSRPYAPGGTVYWTTYNYDSQGRVLSVVQPASAGTTTYLYEGNTTKVTSPAGKWKRHEVDSSGNLTKVTEPNPAGGADYVTNYTYDLQGRLLTVSMPRPTGTQTRTFTYDGNGKVLTATNPETGTVTNSYESLTGLLLHKIDAKNNKVAYSYDSYKRVTEIKRYVWESGAHVEKPEQGTKFYYDANPFLGGWATNLNGRLAAVETYSKRGGAAWNAPGGGTAWTTMTFREMYSYSTGGLMQKKRLALSGQWSTGQPVASDFLESSYTFDSEGRMTGQVYPAAHELAGGVEVAGASYTYGFDDMGRPKTMAQSGASTLVSDVTYNAASQPLTIAAGVGWVNSEARVYNSLGQLTSLTNGTRRFAYDFSPTANDGRITTQRSYAGTLQETITYSYDSLNRLSSAGQSGVWSAAYQYDGFGNLTNVTPTGTGPSAMNVAIDAATNRVTGGGWVYDANGNATAMPGGFTGSYDVENRLLEANKNSAMLYGYGADNRRIYEVKRAAVNAGGDTTEEHVTYWSGQRIGKYKVRWDSTSVFVLARAEAENVYFGSKPLRLGAETNVVTDRLGSVRRDVRDYFPYGQERTSTYPGDQEKYATSLLSKTGWSARDGVVRAGVVRLPSAILGRGLDC